MIIERFGHAALRVEVAGTSILVDPGTYSVDPAFELVGLDAIVVTHQHPDHADPERIPRLLEGNPSARLVAESGAAGKLAATGRAWEVLEPGRHVEIGGTRITGVGGTHAVIHPELPAVGNVGVTIAAEGQPTLFHPGDAYEDSPPRADVLALPVSAPWAKLSETVEFARRVGARVVIPIHDSALTGTGYPIYWRTIEQLGGSARCERLGPTDRLELS